MVYAGVTRSQGAVPSYEELWHNCTCEGWTEIEVGDGYDCRNSKAILQWTEGKKKYFFKIGLAVGAFLFKCETGGFLLEHAVGLYAYIQYAPQTVWSQYFYANAAHEAAVRILGTSILGFSPTTLATLSFALLASVVVIKVSVMIYNGYYAREYEEYRVVLTITGLVKKLIPRMSKP